LRPFARETGSSESVDPVTMFVAAPVRSSTGKIIAVLALSIKPEEEFTRIFSLARMGSTGESYAFDRRGMMLTVSRFDKQLKALRLIPNTPGATAILNLRLLDPGVDLSVGETAPKPRSEWPLTRMARAAVMGENGYDVQGYRNYRGVMVVGAWAWLPEYRMGVATEVPAEEAFSTLHLLRKAFLVLFLLLVLSGLAIFAFTLMLERLQASIRRSTLNTGRVGQYVLVQEIGQGANGMVYRARHSLLRRPVAIKLLSPEMTNETTVARFEHEVQMTSQLTHPNTVAIYDYGRTPEGLFYYAMEYLSGINLDQLVRQFGPQPCGRVIHVLRQVCGSLAEAHRIGLIHRDIKPANIVLTRRGGLCDVVKVLDFGLVKVRHSVTANKDRKTIVGTPHFISPEAIKNPDQIDPRSDLYSVAAVGFWLLTGKTLFESDQVTELLNRQMWLNPVSPSERLGRQIPPDLESVIMRCLSKAPEQRPVSAQELEQALAGCADDASWTAQDAEKWWNTNMAGIEAMPPPATAEKTLVIHFR
jgi:tRNA A-37 threonylcarbamoyl transferase component Bud32